MPTPTPPATTTVLGRTIAYASGGRGGRDVLFIHGFGSDRSTWMFNLPAVAEANRVFAIDLPGHGGSSLDVGTGNLQFLTSVVLGFLDQIKIGRAHIVAHSLGGAVALQIAANDPKRVIGLSLIAPAGFSDTINRDFTDAFVSISDVATARATLGLLVARPTMVGAQMVSDALAYVGRPGAAEALGKISSAVFPDGRQHNRFDDRIADLGVPAEIVWGVRDQILMPWRAAPRDIPLHLVENAGHLVHMERPHEVNVLLLRAVARPE